MNMSNELNSKAIEQAQHVAAFARRMGFTSASVVLIDVIHDDKRFETLEDIFDHYRLMEIEEDELPVLATIQLQIDLGLVSCEFNLK
jgi:hypothetical protein